MDRNSRFHTPWRGVLAMLGGYGVAAGWTAGLARALPGGRADAVLAATMASFAIVAGSAIWAFAAATLTRAAIGLLVVALLGGMVLWAAA